MQKKFLGIIHGLTNKVRGPEGSRYWIYFVFLGYKNEKGRFYSNETVGRY